MLSFWDTKTPSRFMQNESLKALQPFLIAFKNKEEKLKKDVKNYPKELIHERKLTIVSGVLNAMNAIINEFNRHPACADAEEEKKQLVKLITDLSLTVQTKFRGYENTLSFPRNNYKKNWKKAESIAVAVGTFSLAGVASYFVPLGGIGAIFNLFYAAPRVNETISNATGLNDTTIITDSTQLFTDLIKTISGIGENLKLKKNWDKELVNDKNYSIPSAFLCPITGVAMKDPYLCLLDEYTYEREAILKHLHKDPRSPLNRKPIPAGKTPEDMIRENRNLRDAIEESRENYPMIYDSERENDNYRARV